MEDTTTEGVVDKGAENAQPETGNWKPEAVLKPTEQDEPQQQDQPEPDQADYEDTSSEPEVEAEDDNSTWLASKGIDPSDPEAINKIAKSYREAEKMATQKAMRAKELERSMTEMSDDAAEEVAYSTGQDPELLKRLQRFEVKSTINDFFTENPDAKQYEQDMIFEMQNSGLYGTPEAMLKAAYAMAVSKNPNKVKSAARKETLENLAQRQQASVPTGNATNSGISSNRITPQNVDELVAKNDLAWFQKHYDEINRAMAG
jgi:hypothetical protein